MAPAVMAGLMESPAPMPISATPTVPAVDQELPEAMDTMAQIMQAVSRNTEGLMIFSPQ